jgi:hypothetical protein
MARAMIERDREHRDADERGLVDGAADVGDAVAPLVAIVVGGLAVGQEHEELAPRRRALEERGGVAERRADAGVAVGRERGEAAVAGRPRRGEVLDRGQPAIAPGVAGEGDDRGGGGGAIEGIAEGDQGRGADVEDPLIGDPGVARQAAIEEERDR